MYILVNINVIGEDVFKYLRIPDHVYKKRKYEKKNEEY